MQCLGLALVNAVNFGVGWCVGWAFKYEGGPTAGGPWAFGVCEIFVWGREWGSVAVDAGADFFALDAGGHGECGALVELIVLEELFGRGVGVDFGRADQFAGGLSRVGALECGGEAVGEVFVDADAHA